MARVFDRQKKESLSCRHLSCALCWRGSVRKWVMLIGTIILLQTVLELVDVDVVVIDSVVDSSSTERGLDSRPVQAISNVTALREMPIRLRSTTARNPSTPTGLVLVSNSGTTGSTATSGSGSGSGGTIIPTRNRTIAPQNLSIVFVGDSISRYMYLSLVYFLKNGEWVARGHTLLEKVKASQPDAWNQWLAFTNRELQYEECDCYRYWTHPFKWYKHCENRYYHFQDNHIAFITKFGGNPFHGHVPASQVFGKVGINQTKRDYDWVYPTWDGLIENYISKWNPKPNILLFNQGHWKAHELRDEKVLKKFRRALKHNGIRGIYRTTTFRQDERLEGEGRGEAASFEAFRNVDTREHDALVCQYFECLNVSWTVGIPTTEYVDTVHFNAPINNRMNQQFLQEFVL